MQMFTQNQVFWLLVVLLVRELFMSYIWKSSTWINVVIKMMCIFSAVISFLAVLVSYGIVPTSGVELFTQSQIFWLLIFLIVKDLFMGVVWSTDDLFNFLIKLGFYFSAIVAFIGILYKMGVVIQI